MLVQGTGAFVQVDGLRVLVALVLCGEVRCHLPHDIFIQTQARVGQALEEVTDVDGAGDRLQYVETLLPFDEVREGHICCACIPDNVLELFHKGGLRLAVQHRVLAHRIPHAPLLVVGLGVHCREGLVRQHPRAHLARTHNEGVRMISAGWQLGFPHEAMDTSGMGDFPFHLVKKAHRPDCLVDDRRCAFFLVTTLFVSSWH